MYVHKPRRLGFQECTGDRSIVSFSLNDFLIIILFRLLVKHRFCWSVIFNQFQPNQINQQRTKFFYVHKLCLILNLLQTNQ